MLFSVCYTSVKGWNGPFTFQMMSFIVPENLKNAGVAEKYSLTPGLINRC